MSIAVLEPHDQGSLEKSLSFYGSRETRVHDGRAETWEGVTGMVAGAES